MSGRGGRNTRGRGPLGPLPGLGPMRPGAGLGLGPLGRCIPWPLRYCANSPSEVFIQYLIDRTRGYKFKTPHVRTQLEKW
ncbi:hypothetical protein E2C01_018512 [Portunus trituberculatus]|uniref:Uncharacterized protein n=1 Tax=Portunus trituberculatus TaxID=210409 RepID=A0A5B7DUP5_PORTR|nr:hypothetical protein [Portunus trituberculatus]